MSGAPETVEVPVYELIIRDSVNPDKATVYYVTRDAPILDLNNPMNADGSFNVLNTAFEPSVDKDPRGWTNYNAVPLQYPPGTDLEAYALRETNGSAQLDAVPNYNADRTDPNKATSVMLHVGGIYTRRNGTQRITGSLGVLRLVRRTKVTEG